MDRLARLIDAGTEGSVQAMEDFVSLTYPDVRRLCVWLVDEASADDLAQDTYLRVLRGIDGFRREASARAWVLSIASRSCMDELRSRTRRRRSGVRLRDERPENAVIDHADAVCSAELVAGLDPERRTAFVLTQVFGLTYAEVATISNCAPGTVASRVARAREDLISATQADRAPRSDEG